MRWGTVAGSGGELVVLRIGDLVTVHVEGVDATGVSRGFVVGVLFPVHRQARFGELRSDVLGRRSHQELAGRHQHHLGPVTAVGPGLVISHRVGTPRPNQEQGENRVDWSVRECHERPRRW